MISFPLQKVTYSFDGHTINLLVPEEAAVKEWYEAACNTDEQALFPYWAKLWPAAIGLCSYLTANTHFIQGKTLLETGAGLGLPSLLAARYALQVYCTDISPEATTIVKQSAAQNNLHNLEAFTLDWNNIPPTLQPQVLLISDVNYDPEVFDILYNFLQHFLKAGTTVVLSTPQRLMAKPFIERLMAYCSHQQVVPVTTANENIDISVLVLQLNQQDVMH